MNRFWCFSGSNGERVLRLEGPISDETWWGDEVTPAAFKAELCAGSGNITVWVNSPGGDVFAAAEIYTALREYPGKVTIKIDGFAASAASVIAMSGDEVLMSPVSYMVIHNPATVAIGDSDEMLRTKAMLDEIKEGIINAYVLPREKNEGRFRAKNESRKKQRAGKRSKRKEHTKERPKWPLFCAAGNTPFFSFYLGVYFTTLFEILHLFSFVCFLIFRSVFPWLLLSFCAGGNTYELKTGLPREEISRLMNEESCFNAKKAVQLGFADGVLYAEQEISDALKPVIFSRMAVTNSLLRKIPTPVAKTPGTEYSDLEHRLENLSH